MTVLVEHPKASPATLQNLEQNIEKLTGKTAQDLRRTSIDGYRRERESSLKRALRFTSHFPFIGRGNVLRDRIIDTEKIEKQLDSALK
jgi:hypothetical protein